VAVATHTTNGGSSPAGLLERFFSIVGCCWISLTALRFLSKKVESKEQTA
jgi:hypothetical protein